MKKIINLSWAVLAFIMVFTVSCSAGSEGEQAVDKICKAFDEMASEVNKCNSIDEMESINWDSIGKKTGADELSDSCLEYQLTEKDKTRIKDSFGKFYDSVVNKMVELMGGLVSRADMEQSMGAMKAMFFASVDRATTIGDFVNSIENNF